MTEAEVPAHVWESALVVDRETRYYRMDTILKTPDGINTFQRLAAVALLVLTLPHSNAEEERVFSMVTKSKANFDPASSSMERSQVF